jgi:ParB-like chromosome segregation protein Spo0J
MNESSPVRPAWPADAVERRPLAALVPYARNARIHSEVQIGQIAASIREWGFTVPILVDEDGSIIAGHGRALAADRLKLDQVPVVVSSRLDRGTATRLRDRRQQTDAQRWLGRVAAAD